MRSKIVIINDCEDCPHNFLHGLKYDCMYNSPIEKQIPWEYDEFPDFCPLPDAQIEGEPDATN